MANSSRALHISLLIECVDLIAGDIPVPNCSCHISPPCSDCEEWGGVRDLVARVRDAIERSKEDAAT